MDKSLCTTRFCRVRTLAIVILLAGHAVVANCAYADDQQLELNAAERELLAKEQALLEQALGPVATATPMPRPTAVPPTAIPATAVPSTPVPPTVVPPTQVPTIKPPATATPAATATSTATPTPTASPKTTIVQTPVPAGVTPAVTKTIAPVAGKPTPTSTPKTPVPPTATPQIPKKNEDLAKVVKPKEELAPAGPDVAVQLAASRKRVAQLLIELDDAKTRLMVAETQIERLSSIIDSKNFGTPPKRSNTPRSTANSPAAEIARSLNGSETSPIATIVGSRGILRTGPGDENSALMNLSAGTRVVVETKQGGWYRVITPTGARAWIAANGIAFGANADIPAAGDSPRESLTSRSSPLEAANDEENAAMERIRKGATSSK